ncbi:MAG: anaerobic ribonucleoside-triphosphate reductase activating protein [Clostridia bacterium]|nr:anaerobic ribonucleoside-triphosphate reductase activating protein [Clostridia bacterium]
MNYATIKPCDVANGPGVRVSLFVSGCRNHCKNCFNRETWDFAYGKPFTSEVEEKILSLLSPSYIKGFSLLGGEPFEPENQAGLVSFVERVRSTYPEKTIWCYTGYELEHLLRGEKGDLSITLRILRCLDVLVDGRFVEELKDLSLRFRGSSNQRLIDVKKTLQTGNIEFWDGTKEW